MLWDPQGAPEHKTLKQLRRALVTPEGEMRDRLGRIHTTSASPLARDLAGTLKDLVPETFSGIYGNANKDTRAGCRPRLMPISSPAAVSAHATSPMVGSPCSCRCR